MLCTCRSSCLAAAAAAVITRSPAPISMPGLHPSLKPPSTPVRVRMQAWTSGRFDRFDGDTLALRRLRISPQPSPHSQMRLLADIRHLLTAHKAAAAAAEAAAAGQRFPVQPPQRADVETPAESAAQGVQGAGQQGRLGWGDVDMQRLLMQEPGLILVSMPRSQVTAVNSRICCRSCTALPQLQMDHCRSCVTFPAPLLCSNQY